MTLYLLALTLSVFAQAHEIQNVSIIKHSPSRCDVLLDPGERPSYFLGDGKPLHLAAGVWHKRFFKWVKLDLGSPVYDPSWRDSEQLIVTWLSPRYIEVTAADGARNYFERETDDGAQSIHSVAKEQVPQRLAPTPMKIPRRSVSTWGKVKQRDLSELSVELALSQEAASETLAQACNSHAREQLVKANQDMLALWMTNAKLTEEDLTRWNEIINNKTDSSDEDLWVGTIRGTLRKKKRTDQTITIDARDRQMWVASGGVRRFAYLKGDLVPTRLEELLARVNKLDLSSSFFESADIYRDFIFIHPFVPDGNGRTARVLLDYCLLKTGYLPLKHSLKTRNVLYQTASESAQNLADHYIAGYRHILRKPISTWLSRWIK